MTAKKNKKALVSLLSINIGFVFVSLVVGCFAWFSVADEFDPFNIKSSVVTAYFDSRTSSGADGTESNPFVITRPVHYYNLVELTLSDKKFNVNGEQKYFWEAGYYFEFGKDFDGDGDKEFYSYDDNGVIQEGNIISSNMVKEPIQGVIALGTMALPDVGTGNWGYPVKNPIVTCNYVCYANHGGTDFQNLYK